MAEILKGKSAEDIFYKGFWESDVVDVFWGDQGFHVGTFVSVKREGFRSDQVFMITKVFGDGTFQIGTEKMVMDGQKFREDELKKLALDEKEVDKRGRGR